MSTLITNCPYISPLIFISYHYVLYSKYIVLRLTVQRWVVWVKFGKPVAEFIDPDWGIKSTQAA
jgi:hypothetical protein